MMIGVVGHLSYTKPVAGKPGIGLCGKVNTYRKWKRYIPSVGVCNKCVEAALGTPILREGRDG